MLDGALDISMSLDRTDEELKQLLHDAIWKELPNGKYRPEMLEKEEIQLEDKEGFYTSLLVPNNVLGLFGPDWIETELKGFTVRWKISETVGINFDRVLMEVLRV